MTETISTSTLVCVNKQNTPSLITLSLAFDSHQCHIGHFLGNFKKKFGIKRETAPFVFTPQFAAVLGGSDKDENGSWRLVFKLSFYDLSTTSKESHSSWMRLLW